MQETFTLLLKSGATINEINCVRKHVDLTKGGLLARDAYPATLISLIISDVVGDRIDAISSGPTLPDNSTYRNAYDVLNKFRVWKKMPVSIRYWIEKGLNDKIPETPDRNDECFKNAKAVLIGSNEIILNALAEKIRSVQFDVIVNRKPTIGEAREAAGKYASYIAEMAKKISQPLFFISGGETTVKVKGKGTGGRNQEFALAFALQMERLKFDRFVCLSCSTDGIDYIEDAAGAMVDGTSLANARKCGLDPKHLLKQNDSYNFHKSINTLVKTGPTGTNVNDIQIVCIYPE